MKRTTGVLLLFFAFIIALLLSAAGCVFPEYESSDVSHTTVRITHTTGRIETEAESDAPDETQQYSLMGEVVNVRSFVHIRAGASLDEAVISTARNGAQFPVSQVFYDDDWHEISYEGQPAYIHADFFDVLPETEDPDETGEDLSEDSEQDDMDATDSNAGIGDDALSEGDQDDTADDAMADEISNDIDHTDDEEGVG